MLTYNLYALLVITVRRNKNRETPCESKNRQRERAFIKEGGVGPKLGTGGGESIS